jgi:sn-1 stearoyl-lipid 9-desaturase
MNLIDYILQEPGYKWKQRNGELMVPGKKQLRTEALQRINIFRSRKNWMSVAGLGIILCLSPFLFFFLFHFFSVPLLIAFLLYATVIMGTHGTIWYHRYCTHKAYTFSHPIWRFITRNLVIRTIPEETYVISHHVHHAKADQPGDPYNSKAGFLYCMLAEINHQGINKNLEIADYNRTADMVRHSGMKVNSYRQYKYWGSITLPFHAVLNCLVNWLFWYMIFYFCGGHGLACALFGAAMFWLIFVRAFNYTGHGKGEVKHVDGLDFDHRSLAINQSRPGMLTGEWHNNHHLYPGSARAGFLPYQLDLAWIYIYCMYKVGAVSTYHDSKKEFLRKFGNKDTEKLQ